MKKEELVNSIFVKYLNIDFSKNKNLWTKDFFSKEINLAPRDLAVILISLEEKLGIKFSGDFIVNGGMKNYKSIVDYVNTYL